MYCGDSASPGSRVIYSLISKSHLIPPNDHVTTLLTGYFWIFALFEILGMTMNAVMALPSTEIFLITSDYVLRINSRK